MDLDEVKSSAEQILGGVESADWRGLAQVQAHAVLNLLAAGGEAQAAHKQELARVSLAANEAAREAAAQYEDLKARTGIDDLKGAAIQAGRDAIQKAETRSAELQKKLDDVEQAYGRLRAAASEVIPYMEPFLSPPADAKAVAAQLSNLINS